MSAQYEEMWRELGLDLAAHDALLEALGKGYQDIFLSQTDRPAGMEYFNFVMSEIHGLRIKELVEARQRGSVVIGTFCTYVPEEIITAAGGICVGLCAGADMGTGQAEQILPRNTCALIKSFVGFKPTHVCPYVEACDLVIGETTCDGKKKAYEIFNDYKPTFVLELPNMKSAAGKAHEAGIGAGTHAALVPRICAVSIVRAGHWQCTPGPRAHRLAGCVYSSAFCRSASPMPLCYTSARAPVIDSEVDRQALPSLYAAQLRLLQHSRSNWG